MSDRTWNLQVTTTINMQESAYGSVIDVVDRLLALLDELPKNADGLYVTASIFEAKKLPEAKP